MPSAAHAPVGPLQGIHQLGFEEQIKFSTTAEFENNSVWSPVESRSHCEATCPRVGKARANSDAFWPIVGENQGLMADLAMVKHQQSNHTVLQQQGGYSWDQWRWSNSCSIIFGTWKQKGLWGEGGCKSHSGVSQGSRRGLLPQLSLLEAAKFAHLSHLIPFWPSDDPVVSIKTTDCLNAALELSPCTY